MHFGIRIGQLQVRIILVKLVKMFWWGGLRFGLLGLIYLAPAQSVGGDEVCSNSTTLLFNFLSFTSDPLDEVGVAGVLRDIYRGALEHGRTEVTVGDVEESFGGLENDDDANNRAAILLTKLLALDSRSKGSVVVPRRYSKIIVVGAGPVGLIHATQAALLGNYVQVFEKRAR